MDSASTTASEVCQCGYERDLHEDDEHPVVPASIYPNGHPINGGKFKRSAFFNDLFFANAKKAKK